MDKRRGHDYVSIFVGRVDNLRYSITEADFSMLELDVIEFLHEDLTENDNWKVDLKDLMEKGSCSEIFKSFLVVDELG
ncbi:hypothetical protein Tco_1307281 [Tanacetum coccineum]